MSWRDFGCFFAIKNRKPQDKIKVFMSMYSEQKRFLNSMNSQCPGVHVI